MISEQPKNTEKKFLKFWSDAVSRKPSKKLESKEIAVKLNLKINGKDLSLEVKPNAMLVDV